MRQPMRRLPNSTAYTETHGTLCVLWNSAFTTSIQQGFSFCYRLYGDIFSNNKCSQAPRGRTSAGHRSRQDHRSRRIAHTERGNARTPITAEVPPVSTKALLVAVQLLTATEVVRHRPYSVRASYAPRPLILPVLTAPLKCILFCRVEVI